MFSASSEARDRNAPTNANQIRLQTFRIGQEHRPIRYQLPARLSFRQGHRVLNDPVDGGVTRSPPGRVAVGLLYRQIEVVLVEPAERLSRTAQFLDLVEHQLDRFLDTPIRVFLVTVTDLHEADGRCHHQLAAARLLVAGRERALAQQIQYSLRLPLSPSSRRSLPCLGA